MSTHPFLKEEEMEKGELEKLILGDYNVEQRTPCTVRVGGRAYRVKQVSNTVCRRINDLEKEVYVLDQEGKQGVPLKRAKKIDKKMRTLHSKTASYYLLGNWALFIPFLWAITWRIIDLRNGEHAFKINEAGINNPGVDFSLANWHITKAQLALSTRLVGDGVKQYQERMESVESMLDQDASGIKQDSK